MSQGTHELGYAGLLHCWVTLNKSPNLSELVSSSVKSSHSHCENYEVTVEVQPALVCAPSLFM